MRVRKTNREKKWKSLKSSNSGEFTKMLEMELRNRWKA